jgi:hypothetical protein
MKRGQLTTHRLAPPHPPARLKSAAGKKRFRRNQGFRRFRPGQSGGLIARNHLRLAAPLISFAIPESDKTHSHTLCPATSCTSPFWPSSKAQPSLFPTRGPSRFTSVTDHLQARVAESSTLHLLLFPTRPLPFLTHPRRLLHRTHDPGSSPRHIDSPNYSPWPG